MWGIATLLVVVNEVSESGANVTVWAYRAAADRLVALAGHTAPCPHGGRVVQDLPSVADGLGRPFPHSEVSTKPGVTRPTG